jgi:hypothetical protein
MRSPKKKKKGSKSKQKITPKNAKHTMGSPKKKKGSKSKQKITPKNAKCTMGSPKRRKHKT